MRIVCHNNLIEAAGVRRRAILRHVDNDEDAAAVTASRPTNAAHKCNMECLIGYDATTDDLCNPCCEHDRSTSSAGPFNSKDGIDCTSTTLFYFLFNIKSYAK